MDLAREEEMVGSERRDEFGNGCQVGGREGCRMCFMPLSALYSLPPPRQTDPTNLSIKCTRRSLLLAASSLKSRTPQMHHQLTIRGQKCCLFAIVLEMLFSLRRYCYWYSINIKSPLLDCPVQLTISLYYIINIM